MSDTISRLSSISDGSTTLESYLYLGLATAVKRRQGSEVGLDYTAPATQGASDGSSASTGGTGRRRRGLAMAPFAIENRPMNDKE